VYSCDVGYRKPHRRIFETALEQLGVQPHEAVFIGDSYHADIAGAERIGLRAIWRINGDEPARPNTCCVRSLSELLPLLQSLEGS
jgi:putative hydrolase of the HAD superfamily